MEARILNQSEEHLWSDFVKKHPLGNIHQTPEWGHFQGKVPGREKYWIIVLEENTENQSSPRILAGTLLLRQSLPHGYSWLYAPRGPLLNYDDFASTQGQMSVLMGAIKEIARKEKAIFLRVDPLLQTPFHFPHFHQNIHGFQPDHTLFLDLTKSEDDLLKEMKPKGRYNIKLAEKKGVTIHKSTDVTSFYKILSETTSRDGFHGHDQKFYQDMLDSLGSHGVLYLAEFEGQVIAGCLNTFYKDTATYYYGASSNEHRNVMAPYLLQWQAISEAKAKGYKFFDFFGIAPENAVNHPWAGVTEFKKKFGGTEVSYQKPQEFIFKKALYFLYKTYKRLR
jgi:lipid II:glycine glycyltransferase (peptidoglycan interpeptide bridge formation enzyme)